MRRFSIGGAWLKGIGFFSEQAGGHAAILIGMGVVVPAILQFVLFGGVNGMGNPAAMGPNALATMAYAGIAVLLVSLLNYILQTGSYFASWRLGLGGGGNGLGGAIFYGLIAAVCIVGIFAAMMVVVFMAVGAQYGSGGGVGAGSVILLLLLLIPLCVLFAALYTVLMTLFCMAMALVLLLAMLFRGMAGAPGPMMGLTGGGGFALLIILLVFLLLFWLSARLSCTTSVMADRGGFNLFGAMAESWRLTADGQWRILAYLALLGTVLCVAVFVFALVIGVSMMGRVQPGQPPALGTGGMIVSLLVSIPYAYLTVLVPAGIYRELYGDSAADIFT